MDAIVHNCYIVIRRCLDMLYISTLKKKKKKKKKFLLSNITTSISKEGRCNILDTIKLTMYSLAKMKVRNNNSLDMKRHIIIGVTSLALPVRPTG